ncbi:MAG: glycosyltransferase [Bacteroidales bacterium]|nr:glycosyltransferase [Bacteroidales bacterium]
MILLSIIVPVYNVEGYLAKCLDSLVNQNIPANEYEIIVINDESTDKSLQIAESYQLKYPNIKIISQKNRGLGGARNTGIKNSVGKYLCFVDSDDYIKENSLLPLLETMENSQLDALRYNYQSVDENYRVIQKTRNMLHSIKYDNAIVTGDVFLTDKLGWACFVILYLFKTEILQKNSLFFNEDIFYEDVEWLPRVLHNINRICSADTEVYYYLRRTGSITKSVSESKKNKVIDDKLYILGFLSAWPANLANKKINKWCRSMITLTIISLLGYTKKNAPHRKKEIIGKVRKYFQNMGKYQFTLKQKRDYYLIKISAELYFFLK